MICLPEQVNTVLDRLEQAGYAAYVVGGCVRDALRGVSPGDYDITTAARPEQVKTVFSDCRVVETGLKHGTVTVLLDGMGFEITTFRTESGYSDGRHPDRVDFAATVEEDLCRRDFTVNAMAYSPRRGLVDCFGGAEDLRKGVIRCVGRPERRFAEDALRILRGLRFAASLGFAVEADTVRAMEENRRALDAVSAERVAVELRKLLCAPGAGRVLMEHTRVLGQVLPELLPMEGFDQRNPHHIYTVLEHTARVVDAAPAIPVLRWAALFHDMGKPASFTLDEQGVGHFRGHGEISTAMAGDIMARLKLDNATRQRVTELVRRHDMPIEPLEKTVKRWLGRLGEEAFFDLLALKRADNLAQAPEYRGRQREYDRLEQLAREILQGQACFTLRDLAVDGGDLLALGMRPGPGVGRMLEALLEDVLEERLPNERRALLEQARSRLSEG